MGQQLAPRSGFTGCSSSISLGRSSPHNHPRLGGQEDPRSTHTCKESCFTCSDAAGDAQGKADRHGTTLKRTEGGFSLKKEKKLGNYSVMLLYEMLLWVTNAGI